MKYTSFFLPVILATTVFLCGCHQMGKKAHAKPTEVTVLNGLVKTEEMPDKKLDLYSQAYQIMMTGQTSPKPSFEDFVTQLKKTALNKDIFMLSESRLGDAIDLFKQGATMHSNDMTELDNKVLEIIEAGTPLLTEDDQVRSFPASRSGGSLSQAREVSALQDARYKALYVAIDSFRPVLFEYRKIRSEKRMALYKKRANSLGFYTEQSLARAQDLLALFNRTDTAIDEALTYENADIILSGLEESLAQQRRAYEQAGKNDEKRQNHYPSIHHILTSMIGSYRDLKQNRTRSGLSTLTKKFNVAIETSYRSPMRFH